MEFYCRYCGVINGGERVFCLRCRRRLFPVTKQDLTLDDFVYPGDKTNISVIEEFGWIPSTFARKRIQREEASAHENLARHAARVEALTPLDNCMRKCGDLLGISRLPEAYVVSSPLANAAVMGTESDPIFMITVPAMQLMSPAELEMLVAHELAHIRSRHMLYHTAAESLGAGGAIIASFFGGGLLAYPLQMSLLAWHRESEITADRAALIIGGDPRVFASMLTKTLLYNGGEASAATPELFRTHPEHQRRLSLATEFSRSPLFQRGREKLRGRGAMTGSPIPSCASCGSPKQPRANYCGSCGRSVR